MDARMLRAAGPAVLAAAAIVVLVAGLISGGGAAPLALGDPGPLVRWGLPVTTLAVDLGGAGMAGGLVIALFALAPGEKAFDTALAFASASAAVFTVAAGATGFFTFVNILGATPSGDTLFGQQLGRFLVEQEPGRTWLITTVAGAVLTVLIFSVRTWTPALLVGVLALAALVPMATQGHAGTEANHNAAVTALVLHVLGAAVWLGGLVTLVVIRPTLKRGAMADALARYSSLALAAFIVVTISGTVRAVVVLGQWGALVSPYGAILAVKVAALIAIGLLGAWYRLRLIARLRTDAASRRFWTLVVLELVFLGVASGAAVALARTGAPTDTSLPDVKTPAQILTGASLPPEFTPDRWFTAFSPDLVWAFAVGFGLFFYLAGVMRLHRRGDRWPVGRTVGWVAGMVLLLWVTAGPIEVYQEYLFSVHMLGHMLLSMAIPALLVIGAPVTLAARAIRRREDGTRGGREWLLWAVHTPLARVLTNPFVTAGLFVGSLWIFYYTDLIRWSLYDHLGHEWMVAHFLITGYLFVQSLIGIDPVSFRLPYAGRLVTLVAVMALHAFFGVALMMQTGLIAAEWYGAMGRTWGQSPLADQYTGGGVAWSVGEIPTLVLAIVVAVQWSRSDDRAQRRRDRHVDRNGDAELDEYNARLAAMADHDARAGAASGR